MVEPNDKEPRADTSKGSVPSEDGGGVVKRLREAWHRSVGHYATDENGTQGLFTRLVGFGALSAEEAKRILQDVRHKIDENRRELDKRVDESIRRAVARFLDGSPRELRRLETRIGELEARLQSLEATDKPRA